MPGLTYVGVFVPNSQPNTQIRVCDLLGTRDARKLGLRACADYGYEITVSQSEGEALDALSVEGHLPGLMPVIDFWRGPKRVQAG